MTPVRIFAFTIIALLTCWSSIRAEPTIRLTAAESYHKFPFFDSETPVWVYNGQTPGPVIRVREGTTLNVAFINKLAEPSSIHWHGLRINNAMDGVPGVTQPPVAPGKIFNYQLTLNEAGTFWYHPHLNTSEQIERGLKGVLIVEESKKLPWSEEWVWLFDDWLLQKDGTIYAHFNTHHDLMHDGRWGNVPTINGQFRPVFNAVPGQRIRIRLINGANARVFNPYLGGLPADTIAVDGRPVSRVFKYEGFYLSPGNRIDLDVTIPADAAGKEYKIENLYGRQPFVMGAVKVEDRPPVMTPVINPPTAEKFIPAETFQNAPVLKTWDLNAIRGGQFGIGWSMNQRLWPEADTAAGQMGKPYKVVFNNSSSRLHPMHIHGLFFRVLERNGKKDVEPFTRDTVLVGPNEKVVIGFVPEHQGIWLAHCHVLSHSAAGMKTTIQVSN